MAFWRYQPVHNLYLLIATETGILGLVLFLGFIFLLVWKTRRPNIRVDADIRCPRTFYVILFFILLLGFFDHYFWTLQQGMLIVWIIFGITAGISLFIIPLNLPLLKDEPRK